MKKIKRVFNIYFFIALILFLSIITFLPFFHSGFFSMHDDTQVARVFEMGQSLKDGIFPVRWVKDLGYGYGYPVFNFYSPLPYYIGGFLTLFGFDALLATKVIFIFALALSGVSMYLLARSLYGDISGIVAGVIYLYFPYHAVNTYVRGDLDELFAYAFTPLVFLGFHKIFKTNNPRWSFFTAIFIFLTITSHNLTAFILLLFLIVFFIISLIYSKEKKKYSLLFFLACFLGFLSSSFYSTPAIIESSITNVVSQIGGGAYYPDHFVCPEQLWNSVWGFGGSTKGCLDGMSFKLSKLNILIVLTAFVLALLKIKKTKKEMFLIFSFVSFVFSIFMTTSYSETIWSLIPFSSFIQYPWRFLNFVGFSSAIISAFLLTEVNWFVKSKRWGVVLALLIISITIYVNGKLFTPQIFYERSVSYYTNKPYLVWDVSKISDEYLPKGFNKPESEDEVPNKPIEIVSGSASIIVKSERTNLLDAEIISGDKTIIKINRATFPNWTLLLNGSPKKLITKEDGFYLNIEKGKNSILLKHNQTSIQKISNILSVFGLLAILIGIMRTPKLGTRGINGSKTS